MERVNQDSPKDFGTSDNVDDTIGSNNFDNDQNKDKNSNLLNKLVGFFKGPADDKTDSDLPKNDNLNENWENRNVDYEDQQVTPRNTGNFIVKKAEETGNFIKKEAEKVVNVVRKRLDIEDKPPFSDDNNNNNNENEDLAKNSSSDDKDKITKLENWVTDKFEKKTDANWTQRYVDYDKQDVTPRDISNDYIKDEMVGNVRGVYLKTRTLENSDLDNLTSSLDQNKDNSTNTWDKTKDNLANTWDKTKDNVSNTWDKTKDNVSTTWDKTKDNVSSTWDKTKDNVSTTLDKAKDNVSNTLDKAKDNVSSTWDKTKDNVSTTWDKTKDNLENTWDKTKHVLTKPSDPSIESLINAQDKDSLPINTLDQNRDTLLITRDRSEDNVAGFVDPNKNEMEPRNNINV